MTRDKYLEICSRMGDEPDPEKLPPVLSDLPESIQVALEIYEKLPDNFTGGRISTYSGKNIAALPVLLDIYLITDHQSRMEITETILHLDRQNVKESIDQAKQQLQKSK